MSRTHERVLAYINRYRKVLGKRPLKNIPKGYQREIFSCPIAIGTGSSSVSGKYISVPTNSFKKFAKAGFPVHDAGFYCSIQPPGYIADWINHFDQGKYPELIKR